MDRGGVCNTLRNAQTSAMSGGLCTAKARKICYVVQGHLECGLCESTRPVVCDGTNGCGDGSAISARWPRRFWYGSATFRTLSAIQLKRERVIFKVYQCRRSRELFRRINEILVRRQDVPVRGNVGMRRRYGIEQLTGLKAGPEAVNVSWRDSLDETAQRPARGAPADVHI